MWPIVGVSRGDVLSPPSPPPSPPLAPSYSPLRTFATPIRDDIDTDSRNNDGDGDPFTVPAGVRSYLSTKRATTPQRTMADANEQTFYAAQQTFHRPISIPQPPPSPSPSLLPPLPPPSTPIPSSFTCGGGFVSGRGRAVTIAPHSLLAAKRLFEEESADDSDKRNDGSVADLLTKTRTADRDDRSSNGGGGGGGGFSTARGSAVTISISSRRRAEALMHEADDAAADADADTATVAVSSAARMYTPLADVTNGADTENRDSYKRRRLAFTSPRPLPPGKRQPKIVVPNSMRSAAAAQYNHSRPTAIPTPMPSQTLRLTTTSAARSVNVREALLRLPMPMSAIAGDADGTVMRMDSRSALAFQFVVADENGARMVGHSEMRAALLRVAGVDGGLCSREWAQTHWRFVVWKFAAYQRVFGWRCLTMNGVLRALHRRYEREVNECKRSALRLILERDESPARHLILIVAAVFTDGDDGSDDALSALRSQCHVEVSDGYYSVAAQLDGDLLALLRRGRIFTGIKLRTFACRIGGSDEATTPLENTRTFLRLSYNATAPARAYARLGFQRERAFFVRLSTTKPNGGVIPAARVVITRVYPLIFMEIASDGSKRHRNQRGEDVAADRFAAEMEKLNEMDRERRGDEPREERTDDDRQMSGDESAVRTRSVVAYLRTQVVDYDELLAAVDTPSLFPVPMRLRHYEMCIWRPTEYQLDTCRESAPIIVFALRTGEFAGGNIRFSFGAKDVIIPIRDAQTQTLAALDRRIVGQDDMSALNANDVFDCTVVVLERTERRLICCGLSSYDLLVIDVADSADCPLLTAAVTALTPLLCRDVTYTSFDHGLRVHNAKTTNKTALISGGAQAKIDEYRRFIERSNTPQCKRIVELQKRRADAIVNGAELDQNLDADIVAAIRSANGM